MDITAQQGQQMPSDYGKSPSNTCQLDQFYYDNKIVKMFAFATILWGIVGMLVGVLAAFQLVYYALNFGLAETTFGRVRPLLTKAVIFWTS